jgi:hypothetical protein
MGDRYTTVTKRPTCDICPLPAYADARLERGPARGSWAYVCRGHFRAHDCQLGLGHGQVLVVRAR